MIKKHSRQGFFTTDKLSRCGVSSRDRAALFDGYRDCDLRP